MEDLDIKGFGVAIWGDRLIEFRTIEEDSIRAEEVDTLVEWLLRAKQHLIKLRESNK